VSGTPPTLWILADNRPGHVGQSLGLAQRLGVYYDVKTLRFNALGALPACVQAANFLTLKRGSRLSLQPPWPSLVISTGRRTAPIARAIARKSKGMTKLVQIMDPQSHQNAFDLLVLPEHDRHAVRPNSILSVGALHRLTHEALSEAATAWKPRLAHLPEPRIAVIVGGATKSGAFTAQDAGTLADLTCQMAEHSGGSLMVSTSRRTGVAPTRTLHDALAAVPHYFHGWREGDTSNPYLAYLALADAVVVTGDSISMISEACFTGVPVFIADKGEYIPTKHRRFHQLLYSEGLARPLNGHFTPYEYTPLDEAGRIADKIKARFQELWPVRA
jgi:mitochondrial fission protein ELM1